MFEARHAAAHLKTTLCRMPSVGFVLLMSSLAAHGQSAEALGILPHDLTPMGMFWNADIVVKVVMIGLIVASVLTWTILLAKIVQLWFARQSLARAQGSLAGARNSPVRA